MYNFNHLYYFYIAAKMGGVTNAARHLRTSQSSLSTQLKILEGSLSRRLFLRVGRNLELTHDGHQIFGYCRRMFEISEELGDFLRDGPTSDRPRYSLGVSEDIERPFIAEILSELFSSSPHSKRPVLTMVSGPPAKLATMLSVREIDLLLTTETQGFENLNLETEIAMPVFAFATPATLAAARIPANIPATDILRNSAIELVLPSEGLKLRSEIDMFLERFKTRKGAAFESNVLGAVTRASLDGLGVTFLPEPYVHRDVQRRHLIRLGSPKPLWIHRLFVFSHQTERKGRSEEFLKNFLKCIETVRAGVSKMPRRPRR